MQAYFKYYAKDIQGNRIEIDEKYYKKIFKPFSKINNKNDFLGFGVGASHLYINNLTTSE
jgi:light-regulated signal transduction histidine kinase (bacteriophytochrome)